MRNRQEWFNEKMAANVPMPYRVFRKKSDCISALFCIFVSLRQFVYLMNKFKFLAMLVAIALLLVVTGCKKESSINIQEL